MAFITLVYIVNATLVLVHEIESAYEKEWVILKLPGGLTGFLLMHIPIISLLFFGAIAIDRKMPIGYLLGMISGVGGLLPFLVHKILVKRKEHFTSGISNIIMYSSIITGISIFILSALQSYLTL